MGQHNVVTRLPTSTSLYFADYVYQLRHGLIHQHSFALYSRTAFPNLVEGRSPGAGFVPPPQSNTSEMQAVVDDLHAHIQQILQGVLRLLRLPETFLQFDGTFHPFRSHSLALHLPLHNAVRRPGC